jgi:hypothetical protein
MDDRAGGEHLGIEHCVLADQAQKIATVAISPVEHRGNTEFTVNH